MILGYLQKVSYKPTQFLSLPRSIKGTYTPSCFPTTTITSSSQRASQAALSFDTPFYLSVSLSRELLIEPPPPPLLCVTLPLFYFLFSASCLLTELFAAPSSPVTLTGRGEIANVV